MPNTPGYYMPNYYGSMYPGVTYPASNVSAQMQQSYASPQQTNQGIIWIDGEVGAKAYQMPQGRPAGVPIPLWDTNDTIIYLKSINQMGMPNPIQKIHYVMEEPQNQSRLPGNNMEAVSGKESSEYVSKKDLDAMIKEVKDLIMERMPVSNQNGSNHMEGGAKR